MGHTRTQPAVGRPLLLIFALAWIFRLAFAFWFPWTSNDAPQYRQIALNLLAGHGFSWQPGPPYEPNLYRTPVYPLFLSAVYGLVGASDRAVYVVQALVGAGTCGVVYLLARPLFGARVAWLAGMANAFYPFSAYYVGNLLSETIYTLFVCLAVWCLARAQATGGWPPMAVGGCVLGIASLCRPEAFPFPAFAAVVLALVHRASREAMRLGMILLVCAWTATLPWFIRNSQVTGRLTPLVNRGPGISFWQSAHPLYDHNRHRFLPGAEQRDALVAEYLASHGEIAGGRLEPKLWRSGWEQIRADPGRYLWRRLLDYSHVWLPSGDYLLGRHNRSFTQALAERRHGLVAAKAVLLALTGVLPFALAVLGVLLNRHRLVELFPLWIFPLYVSLSRLPFDLEPRHALPAQALMLVFAASAATYLFNRLRREQHPS